MKKKPTYQELENTIKELTQKTAKNLGTENDELHLLNKELSKKNKFLLENNNKFLNLFDKSPVSILEQDFYEAIVLLKNKKAEVGDIENYLNENPEFVTSCISKIKIISVNNITLKLLGVATLEELKTHLKKNFTKLGITALKNELISIASGNKEYIGESEFIKTDGSILHTIVKSTMLDDTGKNITTIINITEIKKTEARLLFLNKELKEVKNTAVEGEKSYKALFETIGDAIYIQDYDAKFINVNSSVLEMYGYSKKELIGKTPLFLSAPDKNDIPAVMQIFDKVKQGVSQVFEFWGKRKNGEIFLKSVHQYKGTYFGKDVVITVARDITEQKKGESALKESEENYSKLVEMMPDGVYKSTHDGKFVDVNPAMIKMLGYSSKQELLDIDISTQLYIKNSDRDNIILNDFNQELEVFHLRRKDGSEIWVEDHAWYAVDETGKIIYHEGVMRDATERIHKEQELIKAKKMAEESESKITSLINNLPALIYREKIDGKVSFIKNTENITGYSETEFLQNKVSWANLILPEDKEEVLENSYKIKTKPESTVQQYRIITKDNVIKYIADYNTSLFSKEGEFLGVDGVVLDISKEKLLQKIEISRTKVMEKIAKGEELKNVLEFIVAEVEIENPKSYCSILVISEDGKQLFHAAALGLPEFYNNAISGVEIGEYVGSCGAAAFTKKRVIVEDIQTHKNWKLYKDLAKKANLKACWSQPILGSSGEVLGTFAIYHQEKAKPTEADIYKIESLANMAAIAIERNIAKYKLIEAKEKAEESNRLKSAFLSNMSHEIRTPMNGILGFSDLLKTPNLSGEEQQQYISIIENSGKRMLNILNDIVSISKIESGLMEVNIQKTNINKQIDFIHDFFKPEIEAKGMRFVINKPLTDEEVYIQSDSEKIYGVLTNLVKNAIKFTMEGSIEMGYRLKTENEPAAWEFYVKDTGIGVAKDRQAPIFDRFIQADISGKMAYQGAGLGLSISKAYIDLLGGKIWIESEEGEGSTFYFTLPYLKEHKNKNDE